MESTELKALKRAVEIADGQTALADRINQSTQAIKKRRKVKQAHVWNWLNRDKKTPAEWVLAIETAVDRRVTRHELRPDLYPPNEVKPPQA